MRSLLIQGINAKKMQLRNNSGQEFRSLVESISLNRTVLICSPYRTDLIYESKENLEEPILRLWCKIAGADFNAKLLSEFARGDNEYVTFENYFTSLKKLSFSPFWFSLYRSQFYRVIRQEPNHPVHRKLIGCAEFLATKKYYKVLRRFLRPNDEYALNPFLSSRDIAEDAQQNYLTN